MLSLLLDTDGDGMDERYTPYILGNARVLVFWRASPDLNVLLQARALPLAERQQMIVLAISVSGAGDINGDGIDDFIIGAVYNDTGSSNNGAAYVVYGRLGGLAGPISMSSLTAEQGFVIYNTDTSDRSRLGISVSAAGDINADGIDDLIVGARDKHTADSLRSGEAYVIYGKRVGEDEEPGTQFGTAEMVDETPDDGDDTLTPTGRRVIDIDVALGAAGFAVKGNAGSAYLGISVSAAGDFNGDGIADLLDWRVGGYSG